MRVSAILLASGRGERLKKSIPKAFVKLDGKEMLLYSLEVFEKAQEVSEVVLVIPQEKFRETKKLLANFKKVKKITMGGKTRMESLRNGLKFTKGEWILSHNASNPYLTKEEISRCVKLTSKFEGVGVGRKSTSTLRMKGKVIPRDEVWLMETPQLAKKKFLLEGLKIARKEKLEATDELQLVELASGKTKVIEANPKNFKISFREDLEKFSMCNVQCAMRVGLGLDSHRFSQKKKALVLGGVKIASSGGLEGNSDGDVILHSLTNAISSALGGNSLSTWSDAMCERGVKDSQKYLEVVVKKMRDEGCTIENLAIACEGKKPKLEKFFPKIRKSLSKLLDMEGSRIGLTATTGEELTSFGRGEGLQVFTIVLLKK